MALAADDGGNPGRWGQWHGGDVDLAAELAETGVGRGSPLAVAVGRCGVALAWDGGARHVATAEPVLLVAEVEEALAPRWTWWRASATAAPLVAAGLRPRSCWDLAAVARLLTGHARDDERSVWALARGLPLPPPRRGAPDLLDLDGEDGAPVRPDGQLSSDWAGGRWADDAATTLRWAELALEVQRAQERAVRELEDPRSAPTGAPLRLLTAHAESAAALLAVELAHDGLPVDLVAAADVLRPLIGDRPASPADEARLRRERDAAVLGLFPGGPVDLRSPGQVRELLARVGLHVPDTRSWRLEPHAASSEPVAALLAWRKAERAATTYGWRWLDAHVAVDGRLRGTWTAAEGAGRMSASAGLHSLPAELRPAVRAEPGYLLVRADLGQVEPRVLAVVSGDGALATAAREDDLYARVAEQLRCDRPTAKIAVLAAMYGQTTGAAGAALRDMERAYPVALAHLRAAEEAGRLRRDLRTWGGRLVRVSAAPPDAQGVGRFARNAVVQGAAAELFKAWAATVRAGLSALGGQLVLCLHDELLLHVPATAAPDAELLLRRSLASAAGWWAAGSGVRFVADVGTGTSWAEAKSGG